MIRVTEIRTLNSTSFLKEYFSDRNKDKNSVIKVNIAKVVLKKEGFNYIILYDENMRVIRSVYKYLNIELGKYSFNYREIVGTALKLFYSYLRVFNFDINNLGIKEINMLKEFLYGESKKGQEYEINITSKRGVNTVNKYIAFYRNYLKFLGIKNEVLNEKTVVAVLKNTDGLLAHTKKKAYDKYAVTDRGYSNDRVVPRYISKDEFAIIMEVIKKEYTLREEIIVGLMYENGLRIGEVLGLTLEDIENNKIIIRNRLSDKPYMLAKTCYKPKNEKDYKNSICGVYMIGYQVILPTEDTMDKLFYYIDEAHGIMSKVNRNNYFKYAKSDKVTNGEDLEGDNYYVFLNKNGAALSISGWNKILRAIFVKAGLKLDRNSKRNNLNHRFRHGFAMKLIKNGATALDVASALRHKGISSVMCYFRPTEKDMFDANNYASQTARNDLQVLDNDEGDSYDE
ncbi:tyrosine-type recombinase/integrase [Haloimpatiens massiliensis]|uniref:tyrosine-type recombinase/integrase n=1 Tax=Haloimpatiens massiliensis TaxID=1658110 RepID=UPI000C82AEE3|nr:site-specific integrase [Haloimpatiens massiliensis]